jgi:CBS domain-containing protein
MKGSILAQLVWLNVWLAGLNLLPAFPMDGGRVLRALLAIRMGRPRATEIAAGIGQILAVLFAFAGFFLNPFLIFIALFVWLGGQSEAAQVRVQALLGKMPVRDFMAERYDSVEASTPIGEVGKVLLASFQDVLPVMDLGLLVGFAGAQEIASGMETHGPAAPVEKCARKDFATAAPEEALYDVLPRWEATGMSVLAVVTYGRLVGIVPSSHIAEFAMLRGGARVEKAPISGPIEAR